MYIITFYSFKGGVGRTMALVNVAAQLVRLGRKVLVIDFDLEAPGLETYQRLQPQKPHPGIVEYVTEFRRTRQVPDLREYIYETKPIGDKGGRLWVMPAGRRDRAYRSALASLDWQRLYREQGGFLLFEDTKRGWETGWEQDEKLKPDYVLIDSRTGDTDVQGICTRQLPNAVVLMFTPNEQNLAGLENVCFDIRREEKEGLKNPIRLHFVAANVPDLDDEERILHRQLATFRERLEIPEPPEKIFKIRRYESLRLLDQSVFTLDRPHSRLAKSYRRLVRTLLKDNYADRDGALLFLRQYGQQYLPSVVRDVQSEVSRKLGVPGGPSDGDARSYINEIDSHLGPPNAPADPLDQIAGNFLDDADLFVKIAEIRMLEGRFEQAVRVLNRILTLRPDHAQALFQRGMCKSRLGETEGSAADLLGYLRAPDLDKHDILPVLRELKTVAASRLLEAVDLPAVERLDANTHLDANIMKEVWDILADTPEGLPRAIQLVRQCVTEGRGRPILGVWHRLVHYLLKARRWREAIEFLEKEDVGSQGACDLFVLAMAHWGETGNLREDLCGLSLETERLDGMLESEYPGATALLLWRLGKESEALQKLDKTIKEVRIHPRFSLSGGYSFWQFREVSPELLLEDCQRLRRMIQGELLRPAFLGDPPKPPSA